MKKVVGPMDSTEEYEVIVEEPKKQKKNNNKKINKKKPKRKVNRMKDWSFTAIIISLLIILVPAAYMGVTLYRAYSETGRPILGHRFDNDLSPEINDEHLTSLKSKLETLEGVEKVSVELTTATLRIYLELPEETSKDTFKAKANEAQELLYSVLSEEGYFTSVDSLLQYDYEIYAHDALNDETIIYLLNKSSRMEEPKRQFVSDPLSQEMVDDVWRIQEELENPVEEEETDVPDGEETPEE